ncbi:MAG TPA: mechanosensitive ion channel domain-containing protein [Crenalkalicoccus sp.]|jgi:small-conductance mechanosensitive channel|nr:mechanosensitive ion channel domain-containing protein [Crenalkalicoccus sp.]
MPLLANPPLWLSLGFTFVLMPALAIGALFLLRWLLDRLLRKEYAPVLRHVLRAGGWPQAAAVGLLAALAALPASGLGGAATAAIGHAIGLTLTAVIGWMLTRMLGAAFDIYLERAGQAGEGDIHARRRRTQLVVFRRVVVSAAAVLTIGLVLTEIPVVRTVGLSLFASAGVLGIVAGLAARPAVASLIAGLQLALTQPIRIGDAVLVEGEWGHVEEIGSTYIAIVTWDLRTLVVPISYFLEHPFQNWTKNSTRLLDTVMLYADYALPVAAVRRKVAEILAATPLWDGRAQAVQVTGLKENAVEIRVLMSAADAARMFDLRCQVREELVAWIARDFPNSLPRARVAVEEEVRKAA